MLLNTRHQHGRQLQLSDMTCIQVLKVIFFGNECIEVSTTEVKIHETYIYMNV